MNENTQKVPVQKCTNYVDLEETCYEDGNLTETDRNAICYLVWKWGDSSVRAAGEQPSQNLWLK